MALPKDRKGARKAAASKRNLAAPVMRPTTNAVVGAQVRTAAGTIGVAPVVGAEVVTRAGMELPVFTVTRPEDMEIVRGVGTLTVDAEIRNRVTTAADNVARLLEQISTAVDALRSLPAPAGDNQAPARAEAIGNFEVFIRLGAATVRVVNEQAQSERPSPSVLTQTEHAMEAVALGTTGFLTKLSDGIVRGAGIAIGTAGVSHYHIADRLLNELDHLIGALLQALPNLIDGVHHWAALMVS